VTEKKTVSKQLNYPTKESLNFSSDTSQEDGKLLAE